MQTTTDTLPMLTNAIAVARQKLGTLNFGEVLDYARLELERIAATYVDPVDVRTFAGPRVEELRVLVDRIVTLSTELRANLAS